MYQLIQKTEKYDSDNDNDANFQVMLSQFHSSVCDKFSFDTNTKVGISTGRAEEAVQHSSQMHIFMHTSQHK